MSRNLKYCRSILKKVSFDADLFQKEFIKAYGALDFEERLELRNWAENYIRNKSQLSSTVLTDYGTITWG
jgi:DNA-directed RNA polymerase specialized sigma24 family protein